MAEEKSPINIKKIGHVVFSVKDIEASTKFSTEIMGFRVTDRNEQGMVFFRHATITTPSRWRRRTRTVKLPEPGQPGFHHIAFEVATVSELFKIRDFIRSKGLKIIMKADADRAATGRGVRQLRRLPGGSLLRHGSNRHRWSKPPGERVRAGHDARRGRGEPSTWDRI